MNDFKNIKSVLNDHISLAILLLFSFLSILFIRIHNPYLYLTILFLLITFALLFFHKKPLTTPCLWLICFLFLATYISSDYYVRGNHIFVTAFVCLAVAIYYLNKANAEVLQTNMIHILSIILFFSGFHKLLSTEYRSGAYFSYMLHRGEFLWTLNYIFPSFKSIAQENLLVLSSSASVYPGNTAIPLNFPIVHGKQISFILSQASIYLEIIAGLAVLLKPKHWITHILLLTTIMGVAVTRQEFGFLSTLCICSLILAEHMFFRIAYPLLTIAFLALIIVRIGFL